MDRDKIGWRGIFNRGCFTDDFEATVLEISPSGDRVKIQYENGNTAWREVEDLRVKEWLNKTQPPPEEKLEIGDTVEILECQGAPSGHTGMVGIIAGLRDIYRWYAVYINKDKSCICAYKVRLISKAPPASPLTPQQVRGGEGSRTTSSGESEPNSLEDYLAKVFPLWGRGCPKFQEVKQAVDCWLESLKGKLRVVKEDKERYEKSFWSEYDRVLTDDILFKLQQKIREEK